MQRASGQPQSKPRSRTARKAVAVLLALAAVFATPHMLRTSDTLFYTNSVFALVLFVLYAGLFYRLPLWATRRRLRFTAPLGLLFSGMMVFGAALETRGDVAFGELPTWLAVLGGAPLFCALLTLLWHTLDKRGPGGTARGGTGGESDGSGGASAPGGADPGGGTGSSLGGATIAGGAPAATGSTYSSPRSSASSVHSGIPGKTGNAHSGAPGSSAGQTPPALQAPGAHAQQSASRPQALGGLARLWARLGRWRWPLCWLFLLLCWLPTLLAAWPGFFTYDAMAQYEQYAAGALTAHHPPLHTLLLGFCVTAFSQLLGSFNAGVTGYVVLQMMVVSACFVRALHFMHGLALPRWLRVTALFYYGLFPTIAMFACCTSKDTLFSALMVLLVIELWQALQSGRAFFRSPVRMARLVLVAFLALCFRNNALYAFLAAAPIILVAARGLRLRTAALLAAPVLLFALYSGPVLNALGVQQGDSREALSVPMQQLARVYQRAPETFTEDELDKLYALIPQEYLEQYHPKLSDPVKQGFNTAALRQDYAGYLKLWLSVGLRQPSVYLNAFLENTVDAWYPDSLVNGYNFSGPRERVFEVGGTSYFYALIEAPATADSKLPALLDFYETLSYRISYHNIPLVSLLFSPAFMAWALMLCLAWLHYRGAHRAAAPLWMLLLLYATCLLGPIVQVRYLLYLYFALPLVGGLLVKPAAFVQKQPALRLPQKQTAAHKAG